MSSLTDVSCGQEIGAPEAGEQLGGVKRTSAIARQSLMAHGLKTAQDWLNFKKTSKKSKVNPGFNGLGPMAEANEQDA